MKKIFYWSIICIIFTMLFVPSVFASQTIVPVYLDGNEISMNPPAQIINDRTLVPVRSAMEAVGATVTWDGENAQTMISKDGAYVWISAGSQAMSVLKDGVSYLVGFDVAPCIIDNRTYVAIKNVANVFDIGVNWNNELRRVELSSPKKVDTKPNVIELSYFTPPTTTAVGSSYIMSGELYADGIIDRLNVKITDTSSSKVEINETSYDINSESYYLSDIDSRIKFGKLSVGKKLMEITAVTENETRKTFSYEFDVIKPQGAKIEGTDKMLWPVPSSGLITTIFWCDNPFCHSNAGRANGHAAIDISAPENSDVIAVSDGVVVKTGFGDWENGYTGYGNFIVVEHNDKITTQYSHLFQSYVQEGDVVSAGQIIGGVGNTGNSTGNHLDFNIESEGKRCDPLYYLEMHPEARCYEECDVPFFEEAMAKREIE